MKINSHLKKAITFFLFSNEIIAQTNRAFPHNHWYFTALVIPKAMMVWESSIFCCSSMPHRTYILLYTNEMSWADPLNSFLCINPNNNHFAALIRPRDSVVTHSDWWWCIRRNHNPSNTQVGLTSQDQHERKAIKPISHSSKLTIPIIFSKYKNRPYIEKWAVFLIEPDPRAEAHFKFTVP